nr:hypothetical protein [Tanacetum cinerariifolium]
QSHFETHFESEKQELDTPELDKLKADLPGEVEFDLQPPEGGNRCFLDCNWLLRLVTHTLGCCLDIRFRRREELVDEFGYKIVPS